MGSPFIPAYAGQTFACLGEGFGNKGVGVECQTRQYVAKLSDRRSFRGPIPPYEQLGGGCLGF
jgi:hypothetical protein